VGHHGTGNGCVKGRGYGISKHKQRKNSRTVGDSRIGLTGPSQSQDKFDKQNSGRRRQELSKIGNDKEGRGRSMSLIDRGQKGRERIPARWVRFRIRLCFYSEQKGGTQVLGETRPTDSILDFFRTLPGVEWEDGMTRASRTGTMKEKKKKKNILGPPP